MTTPPNGAPPLLTHTDPPADPSVVAEHLAEALREAAEHATRKADEAPHIARDVARQAARETTRRWVVWVIIAAVLVSTAVSWAALAIARDTKAGQAAADAARKAVDTEQQRQIDAIRAAFGETNATLIAQGKPVVPPPPPKPGEDPTEALTALVTARVLAALPNGVAKPGPQGVGVDSIRAARRGAGCVLIVRLVDPATGGITERSTGPVAPSVCGAEAPPRTTTVPAPPPATSPTRPPTPTTPAPTPTTTPGTRGPDPTRSASAPASGARGTTSDDKPALPTLPTR